MSEEQAFVHSILTEPDDHVHRLIDADWLLEHDPAREAFVRRQGLLGPSLHTSTGIKLVPIPAGTFLMGSPDDEPCRDPDEMLHEVTLTRSFYLGATPVTLSQYRAFVTSARYPGFAESHRGWHKAQGRWISSTIHDWQNPGWKQTDNEPVVCLDWEDAVAFCRWLSEQDGREYRLPTEAEWEYACRAGTTTPFTFGTNLRRDQANYDTSQPYRRTKKWPWWGKTTPASSYPANAWGLFDMHGNVWEWCSDWYGYDGYERSRKRDPHGPRNGISHALRGGSWYNAARDCRSALRRCGNPDFSRYQDGNTGFRIALTMPRPVRGRRSS